MIRTTVYVLVSLAANVFAATLASADDVSFVRSSSLAFGLDARSGRVVKVVAANGTDLAPYR